MCSSPYQAYSPCPNDDEDAGAGAGAVVVADDASDTTRGDPQNVYHLVTQPLCWGWTQVQRWCDDIIGSTSTPTLASGVTISPIGSTPSPPWFITWGLYTPRVNLYGIHMESMDSTPPFHGFHMEWSWNGHGMINSIWNLGPFHMEWWWIPCLFSTVQHAFHGLIPYGFHVDSMEWSNIPHINQCY